MAEKEKGGIDQPASSPAERVREERRQRALLGPLPEAFLRIPIEAGPISEEDKDRQMALALQKQLDFREQRHQAPQRLDKNVTGRLTITIADARLTKNYGVTRMDPYARLRVGHQIYETPTCTNGAREPKWNKTINCFTVRGTKYIDVEVYDECTFSTDSLIAHASIPIPDTVLQAQELCDDWWPLSGQEGEGKEGMIHLVLSMQLISPQAGVQVPTVVPNMSGGKPMTFTPAHLPPQQQPPQPLQQPPQQPTHEHSTAEMCKEDVEEFSKMFPGLDKEVIKAVYSDNGECKELTVNALLQLSQ
jgi:toll-interacting protein